MRPEGALLRAIKIRGSRQKIIKELDITGQRLNSWLNGGVCMSYEYAIALEYLTFGQVTAAELAPKGAKILKKLKINLSSYIPWLRQEQVSISSIPLPSHHHDFEEVTKLAEDIKKQGLLRPILMDVNHTLICGSQRLRAYQLLKKSTILVVIISLEALLKDPEAGYPLKKYFTLSELAAIGIALEGIMGKRQGQRNDLSLRLDLDEVIGRTDQLIAQVLKFGNKDSYRQTKKVIQAGIRRLMTAMDEEKISISAAAEIAALSRIEQQQIMLRDDKSIREEVRKIKNTKNTKKLLNKNG